MATFLGPLTTTFTPPASCFNTFYRNFAAADVKLFDAPECFPTNFANTGFYSPAFSCPSGYEGITSDDGAETSINCCPDRFQLSGSWPGACVATETSSLLTALVTGTVSGVTTTTTQLYPGPTVGPIMASAIQLRFRSSDLAVSSSTGSLSSSPASTSASIAVSASVGVLSDPSTSSTPSQNSISTSIVLSTGAKVGICVSVAMVMLVFIAVLVAIYLRRRRKAKRTTECSHHGAPVQMEQIQQTTVPKEMKYETPSVTEPVELEARR